MVSDDAAEAEDGAHAGEGGVGGSHSQGGQTSQGRSVHQGLLHLPGEVVHHHRARVSLKVDRVRVTDTWSKSKLFHQFFYHPNQPSPTLSVSTMFQI